MGVTASEKDSSSAGVDHSGRPPVGQLLWSWRRRRHLSQLEVSVGSGVSARHLSRIETGRARPSATMILRLGEHLGASLRERNEALMAGGYAPAYRERLLDDAALTRVRGALLGVLEQHEPFPALLLDRRWNIIEANRAFAHLIAGIPSDVLRPPLNALKLSLHPEALAPRVVNMAQWRAHLLLQLTRRVECTADPHLADLLAELTSYPSDDDHRSSAGVGEMDIVLPLVLRLAGHTLSFFSLSATLTSAGDVTLDELTVETFHPSDEATAAVVRGWSKTARLNDTTT